MSAIYEYASRLNEACAQAWCDYLEMAVARAEVACNGYLKNKDSLSFPVRELFTAPAAVAYKHASFELIEYWSKSPRLTRTAFEYQWLAVEHPEAMV